MRWDNELGPLGVLDRRTFLRLAAYSSVGAVGLLTGSLGASRATPNLRSSTSTTQPRTKTINCEKNMTRHRSALR